MTLVSIQHKKELWWRSTEASDIVWITTKAAYDKFAQPHLFASFLQNYLHTNYTQEYQLSRNEHYWWTWLKTFNISVVFIPQTFPVKMYSPSHTTMFPNGLAEPAAVDFSNVVELVPFVPGA